MWYFDYQLDVVIWNQTDIHFWSDNLSINNNNKKVILIQAWTGHVNDWASFCVTIDPVNGNSESNLLKYTHKKCYRHVFNSYEWIIQSWSYRNTFSDIFPFLSLSVFSVYRCCFFFEYDFFFLTHFSFEAYNIIN